MKFFKSFVNFHKKTRRLRTPIPCDLRERNVYNIFLEKYINTTPSYQISIKFAVHSTENYDLELNCECVDWNYVVLCTFLTVSSSLEPRSRINIFLDTHEKSTCRWIIIMYLCQDSCALSLHFVEFWDNFSSCLSSSVKK